MKRLIDDKEATVVRLHELYGRNPYGEGRFEKCIEELYAPNPVKHTNFSDADQTIDVLTPYKITSSTATYTFSDDQTVTVPIPDASGHWDYFSDFNLVTIPLEDA